MYFSFRKFFETGAMAVPTKSQNSWLVSHGHTLACFAIGVIHLATMATLQSRALQKSKCMFHYSHFDFKKLAK